MTLSASPFSTHDVNFNCSQKYLTEVYEENNVVYHKMWYKNNVKIFNHWLDCITIIVVYLHYSRKLLNALFYHTEYKYI